MQREMNYKIFVENVKAEEFLKRLEYEVDRFEKNKDSMEEFACWVGWNNFWIEYSDDPTMNLVTFLLLPAVQPTKLIGCIRAENSGIEIEYYFKKTEKYQNRVWIVSIISALFLGIAWLNELGNYFSNSKEFTFANFGGLLVVSVFAFIFNRRGRCISKLHIKKLTDFLNKIIPNYSRNNI